MISKNLSGVFLLEKSKGQENIAIPIYARITINGQITIISTKQNIQDTYWDQSIGRVLTMEGMIFH